MSNIVIKLGKVLWILHCRFKTIYGRRSFRYSGALLWNKLPLDIKGILNMVSVKSWLLSRFFDDEFVLRTWLFVTVHFCKCRILL